MFRFWASDSRGSKAIASPLEPELETDNPRRTEDNSTSAAHPLKRARRDSANDVAVTPESLPKRPRLDNKMQEHVENAASVIDSLEAAEDKIASAFELQIGLKHEEKRLIDARLAQCQAALEQLRRCHLKPYPINCPTPEQMLYISAGKGYALQHPNEPVPRYAPPYGVVDGPYSRHYERWLIPHRDFDGVDYEAHPAQTTTRARASFAEGRTTRNSVAEPLSTRGRPGRGAPAPKLQALSSAQPGRKANVGPCVLKRSDGQTVKLVCLDCHRELFSSTQGFLNHCRIAHKREFKSHDEAAMKSGQPYEPPEAGAGAAEERAPASALAPVQAPRQLGLVNPLVRDDVSYQEACASLHGRITEALKSDSQGKLPWTGGAKPTVATPNGKPRGKAGPQLASSLDAAPQTPHLSRLMQSRRFSGNLRELVEDAKTKMSLDDIAPEVDTDDEESSASTPVADAIPARVPVVNRVPAHTTQSPAPYTGHSASGKARAHELSLAQSREATINGHISSDEDIEMEEPSLSPSTLISNNAPSLVSDDGEYDDSDEGSSVSGESDGRGAESVSDVAEITIDEEHDPRTLRRTSTGVSSAVRLRRDDPKHVSIVSPMASTNERRKRRA